ncbi:hypothetical protein SRHO_G00188970, partial [Serrasalmus rhombeus]
NLGITACESLESVLTLETSSLKELDISSNDLQDSGVEVLSAGLKSSHCQLEILRLASCNLGITACESLESVLTLETSSLKELDISNNDLQDSGVEVLSAGLKNLHCQLGILRLASCNLGIKACESLESVLTLETSSLKELDISNNDLQDSGVEVLFAGLKSSHCQLEILRLASCNLGIKACESLESVLTPETTSLKELDISHNDLQDSGAEVLSAGLKSSHCQLEILRLSGCMIKEKGCSSLASALSSNPSHLKELDLTYNHPGQSGVKLLSARLDDLHCSLNTLRLEHGGEIRIQPGPKKYSCEFTLDPNTANRRLSLTDGNRKVEYLLTCWGQRRLANQEASLRRVIHSVSKSRLLKLLALIQQRCSSCLFMVISGASECGAGRRARCISAISGLYPNDPRWRHPRGATKHQNNNPYRHFTSFSSACCVISALYKQKSETPPKREASWGTRALSHTGDAHAPTWDFPLQRPLTLQQNGRDSAADEKK